LAPGWNEAPEARKARSGVSLFVLVFMSSRAESAEPQDQNSAGASPAPPNPPTLFEETSSDRRKINQLALAIRISPNDKPTLDRIFPNREPLTRDWLCDINCMSDYEEYNEQVLRFRELLTALNAVLDDLAPADLDSWAEMKQRLPLAQPRADDLLMIRQTTEELKRMGDTLIRILVKYE
jgi:hypothetical protein